MSDKNLTVIISDLHIGGGRNDSGDDHVYQNDELVGFLDNMADTPHGRKGEIELFINGDFLEFAQVEQSVYQSPSIDYWCTQKESVRKLDAIINGHPSIFDALGRFQATGSRMTIAAGNHDVDLYWEAVRQRLRDRVGPKLVFEAPKTWYGRYGGRLQISHGHMADPVNAFKQWEDPRTFTSGHVERLEMCPGTLFMVKVVNKLEARYPFADNVHPYGNLARILLKEDKDGLREATLMFLEFLVSHPVTLSDEGADDYGNRVLTLLHNDGDYARKVVEAYSSIEPGCSIESLRQRVKTGGQLARLMFELYGCIRDEQWTDVFASLGGSSLGLDGSSNTLGLVTLNPLVFGRDKLRRVAEARCEECPQTEVVVMGHTHLPDRHAIKNGAATYYNPGSWTRYWDFEKDPNPNVTLADLKDESKYPYELNCVRINSTSDGSLEHCKLRFLP